MGRRKITMKNNYPKLNSMQETIRAFGAWLDANANNYKTELRNAGKLFWGDREGIRRIIPNQETEMFFNEWLIMDFAVNGYDGIPAAKRKNFLDIFLEGNSSDLSKEARIFAENTTKSFLSFYKIKKAKSGSFTDIEDLFSGSEIRTVDKNLSKAAKKNQIICGRFCRNERDEYIGAGSQNLFIPEDLFNLLRDLIGQAYKMAYDAGDLMSIDQFLKWNSYIFTGK